MERIIDLQKAFTVKLSRTDSSRIGSRTEFIGKTSLNVEIGEKFSMISQLEKDKSLRIVKTNKIMDIKQINEKMIEIKTENGYEYKIEIIDCPLKTNIN